MRKAHQEGEHRKGGHMVDPRVRRWEFCECGSSPLQSIVIKLGICKKELYEHEKQSYAKKVHLKAVLWRTNSLGLVCGWMMPI